MFSWEGKGKLLRRHKMADFTLTILSHKYMLHTSNCWYCRLQVFLFGAYSNILMFSCRGIFYKQWSWNATIVVSHVCEETSFFETITRSTVIDLGLHKRNITYYFLFCKSGEKLEATDAAVLHVLVGCTCFDVIIFNP